MGKDLTGLFSSAFQKYSKMTGERLPGYNVDGRGQMHFQNTPIVQTNPLAHQNINAIMGNSQPSYDGSTLDNFVNYALYPELKGLKDRERNDNKEKEQIEKLKSLTSSEVNFMGKLLQRPFIIEAKKVREFAEKTGETLGTERLEELKLIKRERDDDELIFTITRKGQQVYQAYKENFEEGNK